MIKFDEYILPSVISCKVERYARNKDVKYNANGDMMIDIVTRKYKLILEFAPLDEVQTRKIMDFTEKIFFDVSFICPHKGEITRTFHVENEPMKFLKHFENSFYFENLVLELVER